MHDYRYNPFSDALELIAIMGETHVIPTNSPFTIRLAEVPLKESPSTVSLTIGGVAGVEVAADPAAGEFRCDYTTGADEDDNWNTGLIQFNAADAGKNVVAAYNGTGSLASADYRGHQLFTTVGTATFIVPKGVNKVYVSGCGGGGRGGSNNSFNGGSGGGGGAAVLKQAVSVIPGTQHTITVGAGGTSGSGGTSSFGSLLSLAGGGAGSSNTTGGSAGGAGGSAGGGGSFFQTATNDYAAGANGGGTIFGAGGGGGRGGGTGGGSNGGLYGAGGGGGGGNSGSGGNAAGGNGAQGFILVEW